MQVNKSVKRMQNILFVYNKLKATAAFTGQKL